MTGQKPIEVPLPEGADPTAEDLELLQRTLQAVVELRYERRDWEPAARRLESDGWEVRCRLGWIAEARRGREFEQAFGATRGQAFAELTTLTEMDALAGYSS
jgi:hypothetical protein